ncbi:MAG: VanZ family protein [Candidatus Thiodiazotropha sp.]
MSHKRLLFRLLLLCALLAISYLAFTPVQYPVAASLNDKISHLAAFLCLALLVDFSWTERGWTIQKFLPLLCYGLFIETVQAFLPYREFSIWDLLADAVGLIIYGLSLPYLLRQPLFQIARH